MTELQGTFACPICGYDKPHHHTTDEIEMSRPTIAGVLAYCRYNIRHLRTGDSTDRTKNVAAAIYERIAERLESIVAAQSPEAAKPAQDAECRRCGGDGYINVHANLPDVACPDCDGTG